MITDAHLKMELKFYYSVILSKFDGKSSKVNQVIFFSTPIGIPNMKVLAKYVKHFLRYLAHKIFKFCFHRDITQKGDMTRT